MVEDKSMNKEVDLEVEDISRGRNTHENRSVDSTLGVWEIQVSSSMPMVHRILWEVMGDEIAKKAKSRFVCYV